MLMAAARLDLPAILLVGGPMAGGIEFDGRKSDSTSVSEAVGMLSAGLISKEEFSRLEDNAAPSCGSCSYYGTANSMGCAAEAMGLSLTGSSLIPATSSARMRAAEATGRAIVDLVNGGVTARRIITRSSLENAARIMVATGGSTNTFIHLSAIANEIGVDAKTMMGIYDRASEAVPSVARVNPSSEFDMEDFYRAGGIPQVMKELGEDIDLSCLTVSGETLGENLEKWSHPFEVDRRVIRSKEDPFSRSGGLAVLRGNLAPGTGITKPIAIDPSMHYFSGPARVFECEEDANEAILSGKIAEGDVMVIRNEGPKGGPGMREMYFAMKLLYGRGLAKKTALITDGRFSGTNNGCFVGHISPEAAEDGPIAAVNDGDRITIDIKNKRLDVDLSPEEITYRLKHRVRPPKKEYKGILGLYAKLAASAAEGGMIRI